MTDIADTRSEAEQNPKDECQCGDYRSSHKDGIGACQICSWNHPPEMKSCLKFRLSRTASRLERKEQQ